MANIAARELPAMGILPLTLVVLLPALITFITGHTTALMELSFPVRVLSSSPAG